MKTNLTYIYGILPGLKVTQALIYQKSINLPWAKIRHYVFAALREAFRDTVLSETEMEFLLIGVTGFLASARKTISRHIVANHHPDLNTQHNSY